MFLKKLSPALQKVYLNNNNITGAFYWKEDNGEYNVYIGDNINFCGWVEYKGLNRKEAISKTKETQELIDSILKG